MLCAVDIKEPLRYLENVFVDTMRKDSLTAKGILETKTQLISYQRLKSSTNLLQQRISVMLIEEKLLDASLQLVTLILLEIFFTFSIYHIFKMLMLTA